MEISFRKRPIKTSNTILMSLAEVKVKSIDIIDCTPTYLSVSIRNLSKKEVKSFVENGFKLVDAGNKRQILVFNGE